MADVPLYWVPVELTDWLSRLLLKTQTLSDDGKFTCYGNIIILYSGPIIYPAPLPLGKKKADINILVTLTL